MTNNDRFVLGVDLDGVCADYTSGLRGFLITRGVDPARLSAPTTWSLATAGWFDDDEGYLEGHRAAVAAGLFVALPELDGMSDALWRLSDDDEVHIRIVTHRLIGHGHHEAAVADTVRWLNAPRPDGRPRVPFRDLCYLGDKVAAGADCYIDDAPHNVEALRDAGRDVIVFDAPYNQHVPGPRARNWVELEAMIRERVAARRSN